MTYRAEVRDIGGAAVGTSVLRTASKTRAVRFIAQTTRERWAGTWRLIDENDNQILMEGP